jgi:hypothetical protein
LPDDADAKAVAEAFVATATPLIDEKSKQIAQETAQLDNFLAKAAPKNLD